MFASPFRGALGAAAPALGAAAVAFLATPAFSHAVLERREARPDSFYRGVVQITHGCQGSPTRQVTVTIPDGAVGAKPMPKPGWTVATTRGPYAHAYPFVHGSLSEGVKSITWTGGTLADDLFDEFTFSVRLSDEFKPGQSVYFPVEQTCEKGAYHWVQIPAPGQDPHALAEPAPSVRIVAADGTTASRSAPVTAVAMMPMAAPVRAGDLTIEQPWMRATPGGAKVAGGYVRITNTGTVADRLVGVSIPLAGRGEVHEMSMDGGVMKMRPVEGGLEIAPGQTVELKPGGFHLMFMDLSGGLKEGDTVHGTLVFARAGTVEVEFRVGGLGAQGPAAAHQH